MYTDNVVTIRGFINLLVNADPPNVKDYCVFYVIKFKVGLLSITVLTLVKGHL